MAGLAAHSNLSLRSPITTGYALMLAVPAHTVGWPMAEGGSQQIADALVSLFESLGGTIECGHPVTSLDGPIPWTAADATRAGTVHLGGSGADISRSEELVQRGAHPEDPFVILAQPTLFDPSRAPAGIHTAWPYCHVPSGSSVDMTDRIESRIERFAPGFRDRIIGRHVMGPEAMEAHDANHVGGDINGGVADLRQFLARPTVGLHPWRTPVKGLYLCSSSTPPGGGVHGMSGWHAAQEVLRER